MAHDPGSMVAVETLGVDPVPRSRRVMKARTVFVVWALASASATTPIIGLLLTGMSVGRFTILVGVATLCGLWPGMVMSEMGRDYPVISMVTAKRTFGAAGTAALTTLYALVGAAWFGLNTAVGAEIVGALFPGLASDALVLLGAAQTALVLFGMPLLERFYKYTGPIFVLCYGVLAYYLFFRYPFSWPTQSGPVAWGRDIDLVLSFSLLAWAYDFPTVTRFCIPRDADEPILTRWWYRLSAPLGVMSAVLVMGVLGLLSLHLTGLWNVALLAKSLPVWGDVAAVGVILAIAHTNAMNLYPAVTKVMMLVDAARVRRSPIQQPFTVIALGTFSTYLAYAGILDGVQSFLSILGGFLFPFTFILVLDYGLSRTSRASGDGGLPMGEAGARPWAAVAALVLGVALGEWSPPFTGYVARFVPWQMVVAISAALLYGATRYYFVGESTAGGAPGVVGDE
ncbi:purine-cytosine permease family protein [Acidiferrobacter sp.]